MLVGAHAAALLRLGPDMEPIATPFSDCLVLGGSPFWGNPDKFIRMLFEQYEKPCMIYVTCPDRELARTIALTLVEEKLIACANIIDGMTSIYRWENKIEETTECLLLGKSQLHLSSSIETRIRAMHPHKNPCFVVYQASDVSMDFSEWIRENLIS